jgi:para-nitrobenzyl esterase
VKASKGFFGTIPLAALLALSTAAAAGGMVAIPSDPIRTESGLIAGTQLESGVRAYLGVPFAAPPTGARRWAPPAPAHWQGVWNADRKGPECMQVLRPHNINHYFGEEPTSEDCLYLNLWTPATAKPDAKLPVIVFLYGGGFTIGSSGMANYGGESVARHGALFVNFNYRVGALGFMAHPELTREQGGHSGNYGLLDQLAALRWVKANIAHFGGDPEKVVIMGQSAGAASVVAQIVSPLAKGLFRGAVMSSGCNFRSPLPTLADAEKIGLRVQERLGAGSLDAMRQIPADRILAIQSESQVGVHVEGVRIGGPIVDGYMIPRAKAELVAEGAINRVPIIASYNSDDIDIGMSPFGKVATLADYRAAAQRLFGADSAQFLKLYPATSDAEAARMARQVARDSGFALSARQCAEDEAKIGERAYIDVFTRKHPYTPGVQLADQDPATIGAYHTADIPYWLGTLDTYNMFRPTRDWTPRDHDMSDRMIGALIALAETGNPSTAALNWPAWSSRAEKLVEFGDAISVRTMDGKRMDWLAAHPIGPERLAPRPGLPRD